MKLLLEVRTIDDDIELGAEVSTEDVNHDIDVILKAVKNAMINNNWTSVVAKIYF